MKISIITVVYNNKDFIEDCINSVIAQSYKNIEYIIIDGNSTDGTIGVVKKYEKYISKWISEPDSGIYDAMNKGIRTSTGDIIGFLNSDDVYYNNEVIKKVIDRFKGGKSDIVYGDLVYVRKENLDKIVRYWESGEYREGLFEEGWHPPHPAFFVKREVFGKYGDFNTNFKISADYEMMLRFLKRYRVSAGNIDEILVKMRTGGRSGRNFKNILEANIECYKAWKENGYLPSVLFIFKKILLKIKQYVKFYEKKNI